MSKRRFVVQRVTWTYWFILNSPLRNRDSVGGYIPHGETLLGVSLSLFPFPSFFFAFLSGTLWPRVTFMDVGSYALDALTSVGEEM
jgi:hypothetical protein